MFLLILAVYSSFWKQLNSFLFMWYSSENPYNVFWHLREMPNPPAEGGKDIYKSDMDDGTPNTKSLLPGRTFTRALV